MNDLQIAQATTMEPIVKIAQKLQIDEEYLECYGKYKAKLNLALAKKTKKTQEKLILVTAINPTRAGEGKSTTTIGLIDGLAQLKQSVIGCLREPSLGPVFGLKGGACGGGYAQVVPMEDINFHFNGDMHAITTANNLVAAMLDNSIYQGNELNIDPEKVVWKRCLDMNDRTLRNITIAQGSKFNGVERKDGFVITVATEIMAVLCLAENLADFEAKVKKCLVAYTYDDQPITVEDLGCAGALAVIMKEAIKPNLVQTLEHNPVLIHGGPFANIAHGCNSLIATKMGLKLADYVVTEAGFGADLGAEKFLDIKCRKGNLKPSAFVLVATIRALKMHGNVPTAELNQENVSALKLGLANLKKHMESIEKFNVPYVIAINKFSSDTENEIQTLLEWCKENKAEVALADGWANGGKGMLELAEKVISTCKQESNYQPLYSLDSSIEDKILTITREIYGGSNVEYSDLAKEKLVKFKQANYQNLPVCMAKTPASLSDDQTLIGRPKDFTIHVQDLNISLGAGFIVVMCGKVLTMPGLGKKPAALNMGVDENNQSYGIF